MLPGAWGGERGGGGEGGPELNGEALDVVPVPIYLLPH